MDSILRWKEMFAICQKLKVASQDGRVRDLSQLFSTKVQKVVEDTTKKLRIVEHLQAWLILGLLQRLYLGGGELIL